jgi:hypothetical protein
VIRDAARPSSVVRSRMSLQSIRQLDTRNNHDFRAAIGLVAGIAVKGVT